MKLKKQVRALANRACWRIVFGLSVIGGATLMAATDSNAVANLVAELKDQGKSRAAAEQLTGLSKKDPAIIGLLIEQGVKLDYRDQMSVWSLIRRMGLEAAPGLSQALRHRDAQVRFWAASIADQTDPKVKQAVLPALIEAMKDNDNGVVNMASLAIRSLGPKAEAALPVLTNLLAHGNRDMLHHYAVALISIGPAAKPAIPLIASVLKNERGTTGEALVSALGNAQGDPEIVMPPLVEALKCDDWLIRRAAAFAVEKYGPQAQPAVPVLRELLLTDTNQNVRWALAKALVVIAPEHTEQGVKVLIEVIQDETEQARYARQHAAFALADIGPPAKAAVPALLAVVKDERIKKNDHLRMNAFGALSRIGPAAREALPWLKTQIKGTDEQESAMALAAAIHIAPDDKELVAPILENLKSNQPRKRQGAVGMLMDITPKTPAMRAALQEALKDSSGDLRLIAALGLAKDGQMTPEVMQILNAATNHPQPYVRNEVLKVLKLREP